MVAQPWSYVHLATTTCCCTTLSMLAFWVSIFLSTTLSALAVLWNAVDIRWHSPPFFPTLVYYSPVSLTKPPFVPSCNISKYVDVACVEIIMPVWTPRRKANLISTNIYSTPKPQLHFYVHCQCPSFQNTCHLCACLCRWCQAVTETI